MAEKRGKEEYRLPEEENLESQYEGEHQFSDQPERPAFSAKSLLLSKKLWVPAFILLGIYGLYKFMEYRDKEHTKVNQAPEAVVQPKKPEPVAVVQQQPVPVVDEQIIKSDLQSTLDQANKNQAQLESFGGQLNQLQLTQTQMNTELTEINEAVKALTVKLEQPKLEVITRPRLVRKKIRRYYRRAVVRSPRYHIRAVVPGRAWLESSSGRSFTVKTGDRIMGYGEVEEIDVTRGIVVTSSGREITYGKFDS